MCWSLGITIVFHSAVEGNKYMYPVLILTPFHIKNQKGSHIYDSLAFIKSNIQRPPQNGMADKSPFLNFTTRTKPYPVFTHDMWVDTVLHLSLKPLQWGSTGHLTSMCVLFTRIGIIKTLGHAQVWFPLKHMNNFFKLVYIEYGQFIYR